VSPAEAGKPAPDDQSMQQSRKGSHQDLSGNGLSVLANRS